MTDDDRRKILAAWQEEGSQRRLGMRPAGDRAMLEVLIPPGGEWRVDFNDGAICRSVFWNGNEIALMNPRGDLGDDAEGNIAMGMRAAPAMDTALRAIFLLAGNAENLDLIRRIARATIDYVEMPAPAMPVEDDDEGDDDNDDRA